MQKRSQILFWSAYSKVYDGLLKLQPYAELIVDAVDQLDIRDGSKIVDLGCGTGNCLNQVIRRYGDLPGSLTGVDSSPQMLKAAGAKLGSDPRVELLEGSLLEWLEKAPESSVDNFISVNVLYTMDAPVRKQFWTGISNALSPDGNAVVVTTDRAGIGPLAKQHLAQVPFWRAFPPKLVAVLLMNMVIWLFESNSVYDPVPLEALVMEAESAGLIVDSTKRCYGGEVDGVDVMLVVRKV